MTEQLPSFISEASGRLGDRVYLKGGGKLRSRRYKPPTDLRTVPQQTARSRFAQAAQTWAELTEAQRLAWTAYGAARRRTAPTWAETNTQTGYGAFMTLALKRLHAQPQADLRTDPPQAPFSGDTITVAAQAGTGEIVWRASEANAPRVTTELLVQKMRRMGSLPCMEKYRTLAFVPFTGERLAETMPLAPGLWACAVRFVRADTGQATALVSLPAVWVP